ncbi:MAG TPA: hypothetical protein PK760_11510 [Flavobacteriales bacterium]|nr:hypothetical protein [Flavobacteriales bacterium]
MMRSFARSILLFSSLLAPFFCHAQAEQELMRDLLYGSGKINTVIAVVAVLILGISFWLFRLDRRIRSMEEQQRNSK